jgi:hypothetical protein
MNWNAIPNDERLHLWKKLRTDIKGLPLADQLDLVAKFCSTIPYGARSIDYYSPSEWPTPWEIFFHNSFCKNSVSLIIFHTLAMLNAVDDIELWVVKDNEGDYLLPIVNNQFILNYELGEVSNYPDICDYFIVMQKFSRPQIKTIT